MAIATKELINLVIQFREALDAADVAGEFKKDISFNRFPTACCGDAVDFLVQYLLENGIDSSYVCGNYYYDDSELNAQSHAWLMGGDLIVHITVAWPFRTL